MKISLSCGVKSTVYYDYTPDFSESVHTQRSFFVYMPDKAIENEAEALVDAERIGLKALVDKVGANLIITNPFSGKWESETEENARVMYEKLISLLKEKGEGYVWYWQRDLITLVGDRSGADYISSFMAAAYPAETIQAGFFLKLMAQSVTLIAPTKAPCSTGLYLPEASGKLLSAFISGGTTEAVEGYKALNRVKEEVHNQLGCQCWESVEQSATVAVEDKWTKDSIDRAYELVMSVYRRRNLGDEPLASVRRPNLSQIGITKVEHCEYLNPEKPEEQYLWYEYIPNDLSEGEKVPLVMVLHGGGENGQYIMEMSRWAFVAKKERLICAALTNHSVEKDSILLTYLLKTLPVDRSRVYATGFSMGGMSSSGVGLIDSRFAGIAPQDGVTFAVKSYAPEVMPLFYVSGINDTPFPMISRPESDEPVGPTLGSHAGNGLKGPPPPSDAQKAAANAAPARRMVRSAPLSINSVAEVLNCYFDKNKISFKYWSPFQFTEEAGKFAAPLINVMKTTDVVGGHEFTIGDLPSDNGSVYVRMATIGGLGHDVHPNTAEFVWSFLKQFSRNPDGSITVA